MKVCLSPLTIDSLSKDQNILIAGNWCITDSALKIFKNKNLKYTLQPPRTLSKDEFNAEAKLCLNIYDKYIKVLSNELNRIHKTNYSIRYWNTLCNRLLYPLIATIIDKNKNLKLITDSYNNVETDIIDYKSEWFPSNSFPSFGGSRILHFLLYSIIVQNNPEISSQKINDNIIRRQLVKMGDGKKDSRSRGIDNISLAKIFNYIKRPLNFMRSGSLPLSMLKYTKQDVVCLGDQYLESRNIKRLLKEVDNLPFYYQANSNKINYPNSFEESFREKIKFPDTQNIIEKSLQESIRVLLPTYLLENYNYIHNKTRKFVPSKKIVILNSQHCNGRELLDFFIALSVEEYNSKHIQINHGGCYGIMETSIQEKVWLQISDKYALWSNSNVDNTTNNIIKMPSLRFNNYQYFSSKNNDKENILYLGSGYYPYRYSYDSIFPLTISSNHEEWQIRFFSNIIKKDLKSLVVRDFHGYTQLSSGQLEPWLLKNNIKRSFKSTPFKQELSQAKLTVHCVPQTTYMETITANIPTICFWNPEDNLIREDLKIYFDALIEVGIVHSSPESASKKVNEVSTEPLKWWQSNLVKQAREYFCENVCMTSLDSINQWSQFINLVK